MAKGSGAGRSFGPITLLCLGRLFPLVKQDGSEGSFFLPSPGTT